jgi:hypothetical protein
MTYFLKPLKNSAPPSATCSRTMPRQGGMGGSFDPLTLAIVLAVLDASKSPLFQSLFPDPFSCSNRGAEKKPAGVAVFF